MTAKKDIAAPKSQKAKFMAMAERQGEATETTFNEVLKRVGKATAPAKAKKKAK
ncbi:MAG TPA: hypothetical protein VM144_18190 [Aestuariivirga sp.]|nr:hypothetical protein [Aestuariivirga sp.]